MEGRDERVEAPLQQRIDGEESRDHARLDEQRIDAAERRRRDAEDEEEEEDEQEPPPVVRLGTGEETPDEGDTVGDAARLGRARHAQRDGDQERDQERQRNQLQRHRQEAPDFEEHRIAGHPREAEAAVGQSVRAPVGGKPEEAQQLIDDGPVEAEGALCLGVRLLAGIEPHQPGDGIGRQQPDEEEDGERHAEQLKHGDPEAAEDEAADHGARATAPSVRAIFGTPVSERLCRRTAGRSLTGCPGPRR